MLLFSAKQNLLLINCCSITIISLQHFLVKHQSIVKNSTHNSYEKRYITLYVLVVFNALVFYSRFKPIFICVAYFSFLVVKCTIMKYIEKNVIYKRNNYLNLNILVYGKDCHLQKKIYIFFRIRRELKKNSLNDGLSFSLDPFYYLRIFLLRIFAYGFDIPTILKLVRLKRVEALIV